MIDVDVFLLFVETHVVSLLFSVVFFSFTWQVVMMNMANGPYAHFRIAHLVMKKDGTLDRRGFRETLLFFISLYGFVHVMHKHPDMLINYFWVMAAIWLGSHIAQDKFPSQSPREVEPPPAAHT